MGIVAVVGEAAVELTDGRVLSGAVAKQVERDRGIRTRDQVEETLIPRGIVHARRRRREHELITLRRRLRLRVIDFQAQVIVERIGGAQDVAQLTLQIPLLHLGQQALLSLGIGVVADVDIAAEVVEGVARWYQDRTEAER